MPTQRLSMRRIREVLRLRHQGLTERVIARMLGVSNGVVHGYVRRARLCGSDLAAAGGHGRRGPGAIAVPGADGSLARRPATGARLGLCGEGTAPPQRDTAAVVGRVSRRQSRWLWLYLVLHDLRGLEAP